MRIVFGVTPGYKRRENGHVVELPRAAHGPCLRWGPNHVWAYDFVFNTCAHDKQIKCLTVVDERTRESLAIDVVGSIRSGQVIEVLSRLVSVHGAPKYLWSNNSSEFVSTAVLRWLANEHVETAHIAPGKPWQSGTDESFNGCFRDECPSVLEPRVVSVTIRGGRHHRDLALAIQRTAPSFEARVTGHRSKAKLRSSSSPSWPTCQMQQWPS